MPISLARRSVSLPLPSSPHWVPTTTVAGTRDSSVAKSGLRTSVARGPAPDPGRKGSGEDHPPVLLVDRDRRAVGVPTFEKGQGERVLDLPLDDPPERSCPEIRVETGVGGPGGWGRGHPQ